MIIYIVIHGYDHEGFEIDGVFTSEEKAKEFKETIPYGDYKEIIEWEVDTKREFP